MMIRNSIAVIVGALLLLLLWGADPVASRAAETKALPPAQPATQVPAVPADYQYSRVGKADPFKPFVEMDLALKKKREAERKKRAVALERPMSPLQQVELGQFHLVGIAGDEKRRTAIVTDRTAKKFYPLFVGTYIGLNRGRVAAILPDRVVVEEKVETRYKKTKRVKMRQIQVLLHKEQ